MAERQKGDQALWPRAAKPEREKHTSNMKARNVLSMQLPADVPGMAVNDVWVSVTPLRDPVKFLAPGLDLLQFWLL